jgi:hypothetical protein
MSDSEFRHICGVCDLWLKVAVCLAALYLFVEIAVAFLPGAAVERVLGGAR